MSKDTTPAKTKVEEKPLNPQLPKLSKLVAYDLKRNTRWLWICVAFILLGGLAGGTGIHIGEIVTGCVGVTCTVLGLVSCVYFYRQRQTINEAKAELSQPIPAVVTSGTVSVATEEKSDVPQPVFPPTA